MNRRLSALSDPTWAPQLRLRVHPVQGRASRTGLSVQGGPILVHVDLLRPLADEQGGDGVTGEVSQRAALGHELVDADDDTHAVEQFGAVGPELHRFSGSSL